MSRLNAPVVVLQGLGNVKAASHVEANSICIADLNM